MVKAGKLLQSECLAIDVNLGCPQNIAKKGAYGAYVATHPDIVEKISFLFVHCS